MCCRAFAEKGIRYIPRELGAKLLRAAVVDESHVRAEPSARRRMQMEGRRRRRSSEMGKSRCRKRPVRVQVQVRWGGTFVPKKRLGTE